MAHEWRGKAIIMKINQEKERIADDLTDHGNGEWRGIRSRKIS
jgi:hypothetical protein